MTDDTGQVVSLLTQIRDALHEQLSLQKITASRQKRMARVYYTGLVIAAAIMAYLVYRT